MNNFKKEFACVASMIAGGMMIESTGVWFVVACALIGVPAIALIVNQLKKEQNESV